MKNRVHEEIRHTELSKKLDVLQRPKACLDWFLCRRHQYVQSF